MMEAAKDIIENIEKVTPELHTFLVQISCITYLFQH